MFILNVLVAFIAIYLTLGTCVLLLGLMGAANMKFNKPEEYRRWIDDRPLKTVRPYVQLVVCSLFFWPVIFSELAKRG